MPNRYGRDNEPIMPSWIVHSLWHILTLTVLVVNDLYLYCRPGRRVSHQLDHPESADRKIPQPEHMLVGSSTCIARRCEELCNAGCVENPPRYFRSCLSAILPHNELDVVQT